MDEYLQVSLIVGSIIFLSLSIIAVSYNPSSRYLGTNEEKTQLIGGFTEIDYISNMDMRMDTHIEIDDDEELINNIFDIKRPNSILDMNYMNKLV